MWLSRILILKKAFKTIKNVAIQKLYDNNMQHALIFHKFRLGHNEVTFILHISNNLSIFKGN